MKTKLLTLLAGLAIVLTRNANAAEPLGTAFTYQGYLTKDATAISGDVKMAFRLYDGTNEFSKLLGESAQSVHVQDGLFTTPVDFGSMVAGNEGRWLELLLIHPGEPDEILSPRQLLTTVPTALYAAMADGLRPGAVLPSSSVPPSALDTTGAPAGGVLIFDGTSTSWGLPSGSPTGFWQLAGNSGTSAGANFLGTRDNTALEIKVNNARALRLEPGPIPNVLAGHADNYVSGGVSGATIGGGGGLYDVPDLSNWVGKDLGTIAGGQGNFVDGVYGTIGGGAFNVASGRASVVGGGGGSEVLKEPDSGDPVATNYYSNHAIGGWSTVSGGRNNVARGADSTIAGGRDNETTGSYSFAAGHRAKANHDGSFIWTDSLNQDGGSQGVNTFTVRASGGTFIYSSGVNTGVHLASGSGSWSSLSDRNSKTNVARIDGREILARLDQIPIATWNYKSQDTSVRHIGPMAQDFAAAFAVGEDDSSISNVDADGVALAAIQGLHELVKAKDAELSELRSRLTALEKALSQLSK